MFALPLDHPTQTHFLAHLKQPGMAVVYPTESFYALGCLATDPLGVKQIFQLKQRDPAQPLLVLAASLDQVLRFTPPLSKPQRCFLQQHWPGPLSVVLPSVGLAAPLNPGGVQIAFRVPAHPEIRKLIELSGVPWVGTSANLSGSPATTQLASVQKWLGHQAILYLVGTCPGGLPSTVIQLDPQGHHQIIRPGSWVLS